MPAQQPWVEKYRPQTVDDVSHQEEVVKTLKKALDTANMPHLLFYGPPGTGKTTTALAICRQLYGPQLLKTRVLELNASDDRGINIVRTKIKDFACLSVGEAAPGYPSPPYKIIILDEADAMTQDAQNAMRRTMELYSRVTRFCFVCNYVSRIIEPLASRCAKFRFQPLRGEVMSARLHHICAREGVTLPQDVQDTLGRVSGGDLRRAITTLQSAVRLSAGAPLTAATVLDVAGDVPMPVVEGLLKACREGPVAAVVGAVAGIMRSGYPAQQVLLRLQELVLADEAITDLQKAAIMEQLALTDQSLVNGADEQLQLLDVGSRVLLALPRPHGVPA